MQFRWKGRRNRVLRTGSVSSPRLQPLISAIGQVLLVGGLLALALAWLQKPARQDQLRHELQPVMQQLKRNGVEVEPGESFEQLCNLAIQELPARLITSMSR